MQSDGKLKGTQLKSNCGSVIVFLDFCILCLIQSINWKMGVSVEENLSCEDQHMQQVLS